MSRPSYECFQHPPHEIYYRAYRSEEDLSHIQRLVDPSLSEPYSIYTYRYFLLGFGRSCFFGFVRKEGSEGSGAPESWADEANAFECVGCCICKVDGGDDRGDAVENGSVVIGPILASHGSTESGAAVPSSNTLSSSNDNDVGQAVKGGKLSQALSAAKAKMEAACIGDDEQNPLPPAPPLPPLESDLTGYIGMLSTAPSMQGLGIAKRMLSLSLTSLINNYKCGSVILEVEEGNSAMHVYRSMGFVEVGRWSNYYLNGGGARRFRLEVG